MKIKKHIKNLSLLSLVILLLALPDIVTAKVNIEVGLVNWNRNFEASIEKSKKENKPALVLFQEVPGCAGCQAFGRDVLSHPLVVEAIENEFIPILVYNNRSGKDIPLYLHGLALEYDNPHLKEVVLAMYCFWQGEMKLGGINGVVKTEAGFLRHREVTRVWYDETLISLMDLVGEASKVQCADKVYVENKDAVKTLKNIKHSSLKIETFNESEYKKAPGSDQKKQAQGSVFMNLNLTQFQMTKINAFIRIDPGKLEKYLSHRQKAQLEKLTRGGN
jgi:hypothetical protein